MFYLSVWIKGLVVKCNKCICIFIFLRNLSSYECGGIQQLTLDKCLLGL